jgi:hypothetical protein
MVGVLLISIAVGLGIWGDPIWDMFRPVSVQYREADGGVALFRYTARLSTITEFTVDYQVERFENDDNGNPTVPVFVLDASGNRIPIVEIMQSAISNAEYLERLHIGKHVRHIDDRAITSCPNLREIIVCPENETFMSDEGVLYLINEDREKTEVVVYPNRARLNVRYSNGDERSHFDMTTPDLSTITRIRPFAFWLNGHIEQIIFSPNLIEIGDYSFVKAGALIGRDVAFVRRNAQGVVQETRPLSAVSEMRDGILHVNLDNLGSFRREGNLVFPNTLTSIGKDAFSECNNLIYVTIPASVTEIGEFAFFSLYTSIREIVMEMPEANVTIGNPRWHPAGVTVTWLAGEGERPPAETEPAGRGGWPAWAIVLSILGLWTVSGVIFWLLEKKRK